MCGIAGIVRAAGQGDAETPLRRMLAALGHRGPDDQGHVLLDHAGYRVGLAAARLAIRDLTPAGHQPMGDAAGRLLVYNGEVYNSGALREDLDDPQAPWCSESDTEVVLRGLAREGSAFVDRLRGMFAFALWEPKAGRLLLGRDPFGIKPLYTYAANGLLLFASEVRALLASGLVPRRLSGDGVRSYLQFGSVEDPLTLVDHVAALPAGHQLRLDVAGGTIRTRVEPVGWSPRAGAPSPSSRPEAVRVTRQVLEDSVAAHLVSDVPVAAFLSGGMDSAAVVALMSRASRERPRTFTVVFPDDASSEGGYARAVARALGTDHTEVPLTEDEVVRLLPEALQAMDQPTMDGLNSFVVSRAVAATGLKVALSGLGGDELFGGYPSFARTTERAAILPPVVRKATARAVAWMTAGLPRLSKLAERLGSEGGPREAYQLARRLFGASDVAALVGGEAPLLKGQFLPTLPEVPDGADDFTSVSLLEMGHYMRNTLLRDTDAMSMSQSLEVRVPFVDRCVVSAVLAVPSAFKVDPRRPKPLLLDALGELIPEAVWRRPKQGFTLPLERWMLSRLQPEIEGVLSDATGLSALGLDPDATRAVWRRFRRHPAWVGWTRPWSLYVLARWAERNGLRP